MTSLTKSLPVLCKYQEAKLIANSNTLGLQAVYYGDQRQIPTTPIACIEPSDKQMPTYKSATRVLSVEVTLYILVYFAVVGSPQDNRLGADDLAEAIEDLVNQDPMMSTDPAAPLVIDSHVSAVESGYATKQNSIYRSSRLTIKALTQNQIIPS